jgi:hypothetical protein
MAINYPLWKDDMETPTRYQLYAMIAPNGKSVLVRGSIHESWPKSGWPVKMAREYAEYIMTLADKAEKEAPDVRELISDLETADLNADLNSSEFDGSWENIAVQLKRMGWEKKKGE